MSIITSIELKAAIPVLMILVLFQGHGGARNVCLQLCILSVGSFQVKFKLCIIVKHREQYHARTAFHDFLRVFKGNIRS